MSRTQVGEPNGQRYRFFYHYHKVRGDLTVHYRGKCYSVRDLYCMSPTESKWSTKQPKLVMQGWAVMLVIENDKAVLL